MRSPSTTPGPRSAISRDRWLAAPPPLARASRLARVRGRHPNGATRFGWQLGCGVEYVPDVEPGPQLGVGTDAAGQLGVCGEHTGSGAGESELDHVRVLPRNRSQALGEERRVQPRLAQGWLELGLDLLERTPRNARNPRCGRVESLSPQGLRCREGAMTSLKVLTSVGARSPSGIARRSRFWEEARGDPVRDRSGVQDDGPPLHIGERHESPSLASKRPPSSSRSASR